MERYFAGFAIFLLGLTLALFRPPSQERDELVDLTESIQVIEEINAINQNPQNAHFLHENNPLEPVDLSEDPN